MSLADPGGGGANANQYSVALCYIYLYIRIFKINRISILDASTIIINYKHIHVHDIILISEGLTRYAAT